ncbi:MAG: FAD-dependent oxidoreductase [Dehalococcoidales bacterium]|nr:FAD-dependent oxidoreductase [Dehalococcoidales bacterium]
MTKYVIIGNSAGGIGTAEAIRQVDKDGEVVIVSDEPYHAYSRPMISKYVAGETNLAHMLYRSPSFYDDKHLTLLAGNAATRLDVAEKKIELANGEQLTYDRLLLATGGTPFVPRMEGLDRDGVYTFTTLADAERLAQRVGEARRAVVIGGGLIGVSVTEALVKRKLAVTIIELKDHLLNMVLDEQGSLLAEDAVREAGVEILTGCTISSVAGHPQQGGAVASVLLDNGREVPCDLLVVAIGVVPRVELARQAGLTVNRGIVVDDRMTTSAPDVYACGDAAEAYDFAIRASRPTPVWPNAYLGGRIAGLNMAGRSATYPGGTACNSLNYFGLSLVSAGLLMPPPNDGYQVRTRLEPEGNTYRKIVMKDGRLVGLIYVGDIDRAGIAFGLMREDADVTEMAEKLLADDFGLISLPHKLRKARLEGRLNGAYAKPQ